MRCRALICILFAALLSVSLRAQPHAPVFNSLAPIPFATDLPVLRAPTDPIKPFTVAGPQGVVVGQQDGTFEAWLLPVKVLSHLTIEADVEGYTVPIDVNQQAAQIEVRPDRTTITYAHIAFSVRQIMFSPADAPPGTGPVVLFQFDCLHPTDFTLRFTPELRWMWPERNEGVPSVEWVAPGPKAHEQAGGFYVLHSDYPDFAAAITIPGAHPGTLAPYQERPQVHPVELKLHIDPARDRSRLYPLLMAYASTRADANSASLGATLEKLNAGIAKAYKSHAEAWKTLLAGATTLETPDQNLNQAFQWGVISIEQLKTRALAPAGAQALGQFIGAGAGAPLPGQEGDPHLVPTGETALVAGYYTSADSARPGFGWFFGRDALYTLYAVHGYGDFSLSKSELEFLIHRQRADGKIMHEWSQTAAAIDWQTFPYMYAAADATPLFLLAVYDYVRSSGDLEFLRAQREAIEKAWAFDTGHADPNGIYTNEQGTGWVESWPGGMPHQEVYLALLDQQASDAMERIETLLGDTEKGKSASDRAKAIAQTINAQFYDPEKHCYAFSRNPDGSLDRTTTVYPSLAWWHNLAFEDHADHSLLDHGSECLRQFADASLHTDWGLRDVSDKEPIYDGMSYHQGSVWPLFTGWAALAEYRGNQPLAGYQMLMENADLTWTQDLGADTELLSGDFFVPFGRSTSHQLWSSAMVIIPALRGLFGVDVDAQSRTITVDPHLPATWNRAEIRNVHIGGDVVDVVFARSRTGLAVTLRGPAAASIKLAGPQREAGAKTGGEAHGTLTLPQREVAIGPYFVAPRAGARTESVRVLEEVDADRRITVTLEGMAGSQAELPVVVSAPVPRLHAEGGDFSASSAREPDRAQETRAMKVGFPEGEGWKIVTVTITW